MKLCECGCGQEVTKDSNRFINGHNNNGKHLTKEMKNILSKSLSGEKCYLFGKHRSEETKIKISQAKKGKPGPNLGKHFSEEHRKNLSESHKGEKSHFWKGGISKELYGQDWTETLKEAIRQRDHHVCRLCGKRWERGNKFEVHHIDYDKKNCNPINLVTLCCSCHRKTNFNREHYQKLFKLLLSPFI